MEGLLPLSRKLARACFDLTVYLDPPEEIRRTWKTRRDTTQRGYTSSAAYAELDRCGPEATAFIRPQRAHADIVVRLAALAGPHDPQDAPLSAQLLLRPTLRSNHTSVLSLLDHAAIQLDRIRDGGGPPVVALNINGRTSHEDSLVLEEALWSALGVGAQLPTSLGTISGECHSHPLAITQLVLLHWLIGGLR